MEIKRKEETAFFKPVETKKERRDFRVVIYMRVNSAEQLNGGKENGKKK